MPLIIQPDTFNSMFSCLSEDQKIEFIKSLEFRQDTKQWKTYVQKHFATAGVKQALYLLTDQAFERSELDAEQAMNWALSDNLQSTMNNSRDWSKFIQVYWDKLSEDQKSKVIAGSWGASYLALADEIPVDKLDTVKPGAIRSIETWWKLLSSGKYDSLKSSYKLLETLLKSLEYRPDSARVKDVLCWFKFNDDVKVLKILNKATTYAFYLLNASSDMFNHEIFRTLIQDLTFKREEERAERGYARTSLTEFLSNNSNSYASFPIEEKKLLLEYIDSDHEINLTNTVRFMLTM